LAEKIAATRLPLVISTAGESFDDIDRVVSFYQHRNKRLAIMHCVGEYPTADDNLQLNQIDLLARRYQNVEIGYSTHESPDQTEAVMMAVAKGATLFEKHVGLATERYALNAYSADPAQVRKWLEAARRAIAMAGAEGVRHGFSPAERKTLGELRRAVFARRPIAAGAVLGMADVFTSIPGTEGQLVANELSKYTEYRAIRAYAPNEPILKSGIETRDTRSVIHGIVLETQALLRASRAVVPAQLELEVSHHYGLERCREFGSV